MVEAAPAPRQPIDIDTLTGFLDSLESYSQDLVQHLRSGQKLCHYTTLDGAVGIIGGGDLWLTNSRFSNDDEELHYGHRLVDRVLDTMRQEAGADAAKVERLNHLAKAITAARGDQVYICCFCEKDNLLSQWRGYAENGGGIGIEFDHQGFTPFSGPDSLHGLMRLWKVFYDPVQQEKIVRNCIDYPNWPQASEAGRIRYIVDALQFFMPTFKNADFREEQERRLIFTPIPGAPIRPKLRSRRGLLVPYYSLRELAGVPAGAAGFRLPIKSVLIGPGPHRALNVESARMLLDNNGYAGVAVDASTTPYRG